MPYAASLTADPEGGIWLGLVNGDLARYRNGQLTTYNFDLGQSDSRVRRVEVRPDGTVLGATPIGVIGWHDGKKQILSSRNGLPCDFIYTLISDKTSTLWLYTQCGLVAVASDDLQKWWDHPETTLKVRTFDVLDGAQPAIVFNQPSASLSQDGRLWFANGTVLQMVDPAHIGGNSVPPPVHIEEVTADRKRYLPVAGLGLPPSTRDLEIDYTALSFVVPQKVHFQYKLEGWDRDWQNVGNRRQAFYTNLAPGKYRFRVTACNNSGVWNDAGTFLDFSIAPAYWQTTWFRALCVLTFLAIFWFFYQLRVRALERRQALLERHQGEIRALNEQLIKAQEAERMRIAGELHDGVLQQITSVTLRLGKVRNQAPPDSEARATVSGVQQQLIKIGTDIRHISHELHPALLQEAGLPAALSAYCEEFSNVRGLPVSCETDESVQELSPGAALCIYRIAQEALGNAAKYSKAKQVEVRLTRSDGRVCLSVSDDGVGCAPNVVGKSGGLGLINMRERVLQLDGTFEFDSEPGHGATVRVTVPFRPAS